MDQPARRGGGAEPFGVFADTRASAPKKSSLRAGGEAAGMIGPSPRDLKSADSLLGQARAAFGGGNLAIARLRARQALEQVPDYLPALLLVRLCVQQTAPGGPEHEDVLRRILRQDGDDLRSTCDLCALLFNKGETEECEQLARLALRRAPTNATIQTIMGVLLASSNRAAAGEFHLRRAIELEGEKAASCSTLGNCLKVSGKVEESEIWYRRATELDPKDAGVWLGWSRLEEVRRNIPRAWELLREAERRARDGVDFALERAVLLGRENRAAEAIAELTKSREAARPLQADALFERGRLYDRLDRFDEAWTDFEEANRQCREVQRRRYAERHCNELVSQLKSFFTRKRMKLIPRAETDSSMPQPIFIVGFPRSGTTMVEQTLTAHPSISAGDEIPYIQDLTRIAPRWLASPNPFPGCLTDLWMGDNRLAPNQMRDYYLRRVQELGIFEKDAKFFTDKMPLNETHLGMIHVLFPHASIIHVRRHPLDSLISNFSNFLTHGQNQSFDVRTIAHHYALIDGLVEHYKEQLDLKYLEIRYEDLVGDQEKYVRRMLDFVGVAFDPRCLSFHQNQRYARTASYAQVTEKLYDSSVYRFRHYRKHLDQAVAALRPTLTRLGYEAD
ncbi:MAG TPA: sulfotransferase [Rhizomicrobium sp.]